MAYLYVVTCISCLYFSGVNGSRVNVEFPGIVIIDLNPPTSSTRPPSPVTHVIEGGGFPRARQVNATPTALENATFDEGSSTNLGPSCTAETEIEN